MMEWLDRRLHIRQLNRFFAAVSGSERTMLTAIVAVLFVQFVTGVFLAFYYSPSASDAWASVHYIQQNLTLGWLLRAIHYYGNDALVVLLILHLIHMVIRGAHRAPRELVWLTALGMLGLVMGCALTGNLLPWDQNGYWAVSIEAAIAGSIPGVGDYLRRAMIGSDMGNVTLTRFNALHSFILPGLLVLVTWLHFRASRIASIAGTEGREGDEGSPQTPPLFNWIAALIAVVLVVALAVAFGAPLEAPADPTGDYDARPKWQFLFLYQLLKLFDGPLLLVGTVILPGAATTFLILFPFMDKGGRRGRVWSALFFLEIASVVGLTGYAIASDWQSESRQQAIQTIERHANEAMTYASDKNWGIDETGTVVLYEGKRIFRREACNECHVVSGEGTAKAPRLDGFLSRQWILNFLRDPNSNDFFGLTKLKFDEDEGTGMPSQAELGEEVLKQLTEFLLTLSGEKYDPPIDEKLAALGKQQFEDGECSSCHELDGSESMGPALKGYGSRQWLENLMKHPGSPLYYGELGEEMPPFDHLSDRDLRYLTTWLLSLKGNNDKTSFDSR